jgi:hypothetical protein
MFNKMDGNKHSFKEIYKKIAPFYEEKKMKKSFRRQKSFFFLIFRAENLNFMWATTENVKLGIKL